MVTRPNSGMVPRSFVVRGLEPQIAQRLQVLDAQGREGVQQLLQRSSRAHLELGESVERLKGLSLPLL